jgi:hypothetical protein
MSVQIRSNDGVIFEFRSGFEVLSLINLLLFAKFSDDMRYEHTFSETTFGLLVALYGCVLESEEVLNSPVGRQLRGGPPYALDDSGLLRRRIEALLDLNDQNLSTEDREKMISKGMYPWK